MEYLLLSVFVEDRCMLDPVQHVYFGRHGPLSSIGLLVFFVGERLSRYCRWMR